jgi:hypothetical protein
LDDLVGAGTIREEYRGGEDLPDTPGVVRLYTLFVLVTQAPKASVAVFLEVKLPIPGISLTAAALKIG